MEQFFEHSDLGLGALTFQKGPGTIHCWTGRIADTEILFSIILNTSELRSANLDFIRSVLQNWREYLSKAEHEIQAQNGACTLRFVPFLWGSHLDLWLSFQGIRQRMYMACRKRKK